MLHSYLKGVAAMWISRKEFYALKRRIDDLEIAAKTDQSKEFTIYDHDQMRMRLDLGMGIYGMPLESQKITVKDVVQRVLDHLGIRLEYVKGTPAKIEVKPSDAAESEDK